MREDMLCVFSVFRVLAVDDDDAAVVVSVYGLVGEDGDAGEGKDETGGSSF